MDFPKGLSKAGRKYWEKWHSGWHQKGILSTPNEIYCIFFCNLSGDLAALRRIHEKGDEKLGIAPGALLQLNVSVDGAGVEHQHIKFHQVVDGQIKMLRELRHLNRYVGIEDHEMKEPNAMEKMLDQCHST